MTVEATMEDFLAREAKVVGVKEVAMEAGAMEVGKGGVDVESDMLLADWFDLQHHWHRIHFYNTQRNAP